MGETGNDGFAPPDRGTGPAGEPPGAWMIQILRPASVGEAPAVAIVEALRADPEVDVRSVRGAGDEPLVVATMPDGHPARLRLAFPGRLVIEPDATFPTPREPIRPPE